MSPTGSLAIGLRTLGELLQTSPAPYTAAIFTISRQIVEAVVEKNNVRRDLTLIAERVYEIAMVCTQTLSELEQLGTFPDIILYATSLIRSLECVSEAIQKELRESSFYKFFARSAMRGAVKSCEADLELQTSIFLMRVRAKNIVMSESLRRDASRFTIEKIEDHIAQTFEQQLGVMRSTIEGSTRRESAFDHSFPAAPQIFFGRDSITEELANSLTHVPCYRAVLGPGGIGKTSLALTVMRHSLVAETYGSHRYFIPCDALIDARGLISAIANIFDVSDKNLLPELKRICSYIGSSILFLIDNFETPWESSSTRKPVEELLSHLADIPNLSIIITLRGAELPHGLPWTRPFLPPLKPLDHTSALKTFAAISDVPEDTSAVAELVQAVDAVPLAVRLLATQAQFTDCDSLLQHWNESRTASLSKRPDRLESLDASINLSLTSQRFLSTPSAMDLLKILSILPDGVLIEDLCTMAQGLRDPLSAVSTILQVSLAYSTESGRVRLLAPVREFVQLYRPISPETFAPVLEFHERLSKTAAELEFTADMVKQIGPCVGNIHSTIRHALTDDAPAARAIAAAVDVTAFHRVVFSGSVISLLQAAVLKAQELGLTVLEADSMATLARFIASSSDTAAAKEMFEAAIGIYRNLGCQNEGFVKAICYYGSYLASMGQTAGCRKLLREALANLHESTNPALVVQVHVVNATTSMDLGQTTEARESLTAANNALDVVRYPRLNLTIAYSACEVFYRRDLYLPMIHSAEGALALAGATTDSRSTYVYGMLGLAYMATGRYSDAERALEASLTSRTTFGRVASRTHLHLANFSLAIDDVDKARSHIYTSYSLTNEPQRRCVTMLMLASVEVRAGNLNAALAICEDNKRIYQRHHKWSYNGIYRSLITMSDITRSRGDFNRCLMYSITATAYFTKIRDLNGIAVSLLHVGDALYFLRDASAANACYETSMELVRYLGNRRMLAHILVRLASANVLLGDIPRALRRFKTGLRFYSETEGFHWVVWCQNRLDILEDDVREDDSLVMFPLVSVYGF